jgi:hypothetical protein
MSEPGYETARSLSVRINKQSAKHLNRPQLIPRPPIQRENSWTTKNNSAFIDTVARGWRCSPIFIIQVEDIQDEEYENCDDEDIRVDNVFDGAHKIEAVHKFMNNEFALEGLPELSPIKEYEGKYYRDLPKKLQNRIDNYQFTINYIDSETANDKDSLKILWERLNKEGIKLNNYELALPVIHDLVHDVLKPSLPLFLESEIFIKEKSKRGEAEKLLQMILATSETSLEEAPYLQKFTSKNMLVKNWQDIRLGDKISDIKANTAENKDKWLQNLKRASLYLDYLSELNCFVDENGSPILQSAHRTTELLFLISRSLYHFPKGEEFRRIAPQIAEEMKEKYFKTITRNEKGRNGMLQRTLLKEIDDLVKKYADMKTPRLFPKEMIEQKLAEQNRVCPLCQKKILENQSYQGDHIIKYANGGETKYENLQVTHSRCNQLK